MANVDRFDSWSPCSIYAVKAVGLLGVFGVRKPDGYRCVDSFKGGFWKVLKPGDKVGRIFNLVGPTNGGLPV
jgi:hypothetical protein